MAPIDPQSLKTPDPMLVQHHSALFDEDPRTGAPDRALLSLAETFPRNDKLEHVLVKVAALNSLYSTNIFAIVEVALHISSLNIDPLVSHGDPNAIDLVAKIVISGKSRRNYSFATKYCSMHFPDFYPIYDAIVDELLWRYGKRDQFASFRRMDLLDYTKFVSIIDQFRVYYGLSEIGYKPLDKFLWSYGKEVLERQDPLDN